MYQKVQFECILKYNFFTKSVRHIFFTEEFQFFYLLSWNGLWLREANFLVFIGTWYFCLGAHRIIFLSGKSSNFTRKHPRRLRQEATVRTRLGTTDWFKIGKGVRQLSKEYIYCHPAYLVYMQRASCKTLGWRTHKLESRLPGEMSTTLLQLWNQSFL